MSSRDMMTAYLRERFRLAVFVPLALVLTALAVLSSGGRPSASSAAASLVAVLAALLAFRVWDDLADRTYDRLRHPARVAVRAHSVRPLQLLAAAAWLIAVALLGIRTAPVAGVTALLATSLMLGAWYRMRPTHAPSRLLNTLVVLLKYPALVAAAAPAGVRPGLLLPAAGLSYALVLLHDLADDPDLRGTAGAAVTVGAGAGVLVLSLHLYLSFGGAQ